MSKFADWVVPPKGADAEAQRDWQWRISVALFGGYLIGGLVIAAAVGQVTGVTGFARASDVVDLQQTTKAIRQDQLGNRIDTLRHRQCQAIMEGNQSSMAFANEALQRAVNDYYRIAGNEYRIPACQELITWFSQSSPVPTPRPVR